MNFRDNVLISRGKTIPESVNDNSTTSITQSGCFRIENIRNLPACIDIRFESGNQLALPYSLITEINYDKSKGIEVNIQSSKLLIKGCNLTRLYDYLIAFRVSYIQLSKSSVSVTGEPYVEEIRYYQI